MTNLKTIYEGDGSPMLGEKGGVFHALNKGIDVGSTGSEDASLCTDTADDIDSDVGRIDSCSDMSVSDTEGTERQSSGHFVSCIFRKHDLRVSSESATLLINEQSKCKEANGETVYKFGFGQSPFLPPDFVMQDLTKYVAHKEYCQVQGLPSLCEKVAEFHNHHDKLNIEAKNVVIGNGSKMLIYAILSAFKHANVFLMTPCWVSYEPQADLAKLNSVRIETTYEEGWRLTPARLRKALMQNASDHVPSICIFNFPGNPDGLSYTEEEVEELAGVFREFNVLVISDEIYGLLDHKGAHVSMARYYREGTIVTSGLSKWCGAGGWRVGVALFPSSLETSLKPVVVGILSETISCVSAPIQYAAISAYTLSPLIDSYLDHQRRILALAGAHFHKELTGAGIRVHMPTGGFYAYIDFSPLARVLDSTRGITTSYDLATDLLSRASIAILPGTAFGAPDNVLSARLAYVDFDGKAAMDASSKIPLSEGLTTDFLIHHCPKLVAGCEKIVQYCHELSRDSPVSF